MIADLLLCATLAMRPIAVDTAPSADSIYLTPQEYMYANDRRYTFLGGTPRRETEIQPIPTALLGAGYLGLFIGLHQVQANAWWSDQRGEFHVVEDWEYANGLDKFGHFYGGYINSTLFQGLLTECGFSYEASVWTGAAMGLAYQTYVEIEDGFATEWGFSPSDAASNFLGAGFTVAQYYVPWLQNITPRWSYVPVTWTGGQQITTRPTTFIDDYNSTTFWFSFNIDNMLPSSAAEHWPDWLTVDVGYGIYDYGQVDSNNIYVGGRPRFMIGLNYNWMKIIPPLPGFLNYVRSFLNYIHMPGPTLEVGSDGTKFRIFYPFTITIGNIKF